MLRRAIEGQKRELAPRWENIVNGVTRFLFLHLALCPMFLCAAVHPTATIEANRTAIRSFFGTDSVKLVFVDRQHLYLVDFSLPVPSIAEVSGITHSVIAPTLSPRGDWVVYAAPGSDNRLISDLTRNSSIKSSAWIYPLNKQSSPVEVRRDSAHVPRFVQNCTGLDIVYSTISDEDEWEKGQGEVRRSVKPTSIHQR